MAYEPFFERFPKLALKETRSITTRDNPGLPDDDYGFLEAYCTDENCDCRRVMFNVVSRKHNESLAVIAYGWENKAFYAKWFNGNDAAIIRDLQGPILNPGSKLSELSPALLKLVQDVLLNDPAYINRLKRHYQMFKEKVDPEHFPSGSSQQRNHFAPKARKRHRPRSK